MRYNKDQMVIDAKFVISECDRFQLIINQGGFLEIDQQDLLGKLPHQAGTGSIICGRKAASIISKLAKEAAKRSQLLERISISRIREETEKKFVYHFIKKGRDVDFNQLNRFFQAVAKASEAHLTTTTYMIPCHLMHSRDPEYLSLGPVFFHNRSSFAKIILSKSKAEKNYAESDEYQRNLLARAIRYYRNFRWVAEVKIKNCDTETSARLAQEAVTASLNCLHLLLGSRNSSRMQIGGLNIRNDSRAQLTIDIHGALKPSLSAAYFGEVKFRDGWSEALETQNFIYFKELFDKALDVTTDPGLKRPVSRRFIDAAHWFGEAIRDTSPGTKTIKFVTALERILMTDERSDIATLVSERAAALCFSHEVSRAEWRKKTKDAYDLRSSLVHGSISPTSLELEEGALNAQEITEMVLIRAIEAFGLDGLKESLGEPKRLSKWFEKYIVWADGQEEAMLQDISRTKE